MKKQISLRFLLLLPLFFFFFFVHGLADPEESSTAPMDKKEQEALYSVIQRLVGNWWNGSDLYPDPCGWTQIQGVSCDLFDGLWYVTGISIGPVLENSLDCAEDAKFSPLIFELKRLKTLSFYDCFSMDHQIRIPSNNWDKLAGSLESLEFRSNPGLIGEIPANLVQLANLQSLVLVENSLSGALPQGLGNLFHLKRLVLSGNRLDGEIPATLGLNLSQLLILDLSRNGLIGPVPGSLGALTSLLKLDLSNNQFHGSLPPEIGSLRKLTLIDLRNNNFTRGWPQFLQGMVSLQDLLMSNNPLLGGNLLEFDWERLENLITLDISNVGLTGSIPESIASLKRLRFLAMDNNCLTGNLSPKIAAMPSLTSLYLNGNNLTGELGFSQEFYKRMGRRFSTWNNPNLCYTSMTRERQEEEYLPNGVQKCKQDQESKGRVYYSNLDQSSSLLLSVGFPASMITGFWCGLVLEIVVVVFLFFMLL